MYLLWLVITALLITAITLFWSGVLVLRWAFGTQMARWEVPTYLAFLLYVILSVYVYIANWDQITTMINSL